MSKESKITTHQIGFSLGSERGGIGCTELVQRLLMWFNRPVDGITWRTVYPTDDVGLNHPRQSPNPRNKVVYTLYSGLRAVPLPLPSRFFRLMSG